jgi:hypothetical protein
MRQEGEYVRVVTGYHGTRLEYCRAEGNGKKAQKRCLTDVYCTKLRVFRRSETGRLEKLGGST